MKNMQPALLIALSIVTFSQPMDAPEQSLAMPCSSLDLKLSLLNAIRTVDFDIDTDTKTMSFDHAENADGNLPRIYCPLPTVAAIMHEWQSFSEFHELRDKNYSSDDSTAPNDEKIENLIKQKPLCPDFFDQVEKHTADATPHLTPQQIYGVKALRYLTFNPEHKLFCLAMSMDDFFKAKHVDQVARTQAEIDTMLDERRKQRGNGMPVVQFATPADRQNYFQFRRPTREEMTSFEEDHTKFKLSLLNADKNQISTDEIVAAESYEDIYADTFNEIYSNAILKLG